MTFLIYSVVNEVSRKNEGILRDKIVLHSVFTDRQKFTILTFNV